MELQLEASIQARNQLRMQQVAAAAGMPQQVYYSRLISATFCLPRE